MDSYTKNSKERRFLCSLVLDCCSFCSIYSIISFVSLGQNDASIPLRCAVKMTPSLMHTVNSKAVRVFFYFFIITSKYRKN